MSKFLVRAVFSNPLQRTENIKTYYSMAIEENKSKFKYLLEDPNFEGFGIYYQNDKGYIFHAHNIDLKVRTEVGLSASYQVAKVGVEFLDMEPFKMKYDHNSEDVAVERLPETIRYDSRLWFLDKESMKRSIRYPEGGLSDYSYVHVQDLDNSVSSGCIRARTIGQLLHKFLEYIEKTYFIEILKISIEDWGIHRLGNCEPAMVTIMYEEEDEHMTKDFILEHINVY